MNVFAIIRPGKDHEPCIQAFSSLELATNARTLYGWVDSEIVEVPLHGSPNSLHEWSQFDWPVQLYFLLGAHGSGKPVAAFSEYVVYRDTLFEQVADHPWVDGTLDGLRRSVEKGLRMYRVHMHVDGTVGQIEGAEAFNAVTTCNAHLHVLDHEARKCVAGKGFNFEAGPYFINVYALDESNAIQIARPYLERKLLEDKQPTPYW